MIGHIHHWVHEAPIVNLHAPLIKDSLSALHLSYSLRLVFRVRLICVFLIVLIIVNVVRLFIVISVVAIVELFSVIGVIRLV